MRDALSACMARLNDDDPAVRGEAVRALGRIGGDRATDALIAKLNDEVQWARREAVCALGQIGGRSGRLGFEYNGMVLHEYYFDNMSSSASGPPSSGKLYEILGNSYGDFETWKKAFGAVGGMRGVGWVIAYQDPANGPITNHWITLHEDGNVAGLKPIVVMDVWEHAFLLDYKPAGRSKYIESFFANVD